VRIVPLVLLLHRQYLRDQGLLAHTAVGGQAGSGGQAGKSRRGGGAVIQSPDDWSRRRGRNLVRRAGPAAVPQQVLDVLRQLHLLTALLMLLQPLLFLLRQQTSVQNREVKNLTPMIKIFPQTTIKLTSSCAASTFLCHINCCRLASVLLMESASFDSAALYSLGSLMSRRPGTMPASAPVPFFVRKKKIHR